MENKLTAMLAVFDSDGNPVVECANVDEAIHYASETVIDTWPDYEIATVAWSFPDHPSIDVALVARVGMRGSRLARVMFPDTSLGGTVEVPVGGFKRPAGRRS